MQNFFSSILDQDCILSSPNDLEFYGKDWCKDFAANPSLILLPKETSQIIEILKICNQNKISIVPSGGRTGLSAGATATNKEVVLSLLRLNKITDFNQSEQTINCQAGVVTESLQNQAKNLNLYYPVDFASRGSSQIGGNIATNAGGVRVIRYGLTRNWVRGIKFVTAQGELIDTNSKLVKNQSGYDFKNLLIGSEGTLGVIVEATMALCAPPLPATLALCAINHLKNALEILSDLRNSGLTINLFEFFDRNALEHVLKFQSRVDPFKQSYSNYCLIEVEQNPKFEEILAQLNQNNQIQDVIISQNSAHYKQLLELRELISETLTKHFTVHKNDISVPIASCNQFISDLEQLVKKLQPDFQLVCFGHLGDGNIHVNILMPASMIKDDFFKRCKKLDLDIFSLVKNYHGSISAEHGVGLLKKDFLHFTRSQSEINLMRSIKKSFDPNQILNPGKVF